MKHKTLLVALSSVTATAYAGTSEVVAPAPAPAPAPEPSLCGWFIGGSYGQLSDVDNNLDSAINIDGVDVGNLDFDMYTLHVGRDLASENGWDVAAYLEVAYLDGDMSVSRTLFNSFQAPQSISADFDIDIIPVTANFKVEHVIYGPVSGYVTGGAGYAWTDISAEGQSENDGGFYAQASAGLLYNINEKFELFGGARWLYLSDLGFGDATFELDDSVAWEIGARYNF